MKTVLFVCLHGAGRSRIAAAWFNQAAPSGWRALSAGLEPDAMLSPNASRLLAGTAAEPFLDPEPPRPLTAVAGPARAIAINCDAPGAERWELAASAVDEAARDEIAARVSALASELAGG